MLHSTRIYKKEFVYLMFPHNIYKAAELHHVGNTERGKRFNFQSSASLDNTILLFA